MICIPALTSKNNYTIMVDRPVGKNWKIQANVRDHFESKNLGKGGKKRAEFLTFF